MPKRYVLDQNFPVQTLSVPWPPGIELLTLEAVAPGLAENTEDWELLLELEHRGFDGFITNDGRIVDSPREMLALARSSLTLVVTDGVGHNPLKANGLLQLHLEDILADTAVRPLGYVLRPTGKGVRSPGRRITDIAGQRNEPRDLLVRREVRAMRDQIRETRPHLLHLLDRRPASEPEA